MSREPLVSIIITTYNRSKLVGRTIQSVLDQNYRNFEIIVVDDCSSDDTEIFFKNNFINKIKYVRHEKNLGVQYASNTGYEYAKGKYLAFIGDDDQWSDKEKLSKQVEIFEKDTQKRYGTVTTSVEIIRPNAQFNKIIKRPKNLVKHILKKNGIIYGTAALIRREAFELAGKFAEDLPKGTDSDVQRRIILLGYDVFFIEKPMIRYYEGHERMTSKNEKSLLKSIKGENYKLQKYYHYYKIYPSSKSFVLSKIATCYKDLSDIKNRKQNLKLAKNFYIQSIKANIFNFKIWYKLIKIYL